MTDIGSSELSFKLRDLSASLEITDMPFDVSRRRFTTTWSTRPGLEWWDSIDLFKSEITKAEEKKDFEKISTFAQPGNHNSLLEAVPKFPILQYLGYSGTKTVSNESGLNVTRSEVIYPSFYTLNEFIDQVFPDAANDNARLTLFQGGEFSAQAFTGHLVNRGEVLVASDAPFACHDMADHAIGWVCISPRLLRGLKQKAAKNQEQFSEADIHVDTASSMDILTALIADRLVLFPAEGSLKGLADDYGEWFGEECGPLCVGAKAEMHQMAKDTVNRFQRANQFAERQLDAANAA